jgi:hypothetical protein
MLIETVLAPKTPLENKLKAFAKRLYKKNSNIQLYNHDLISMRFKQNYMSMDLHVYIRAEN